MFVCATFLSQTQGQEFPPLNEFPFAEADTSLQESLLQLEGSFTQESPIHESPFSKEGPALKEATSGPSAPPSPGTFSIRSKSPTDRASAFQSPMSALQPAKHPNQFTKRDADFAESLHVITDATIDSVVRLEGEESNQYILGTLVSTNGIIVSKYSAAKKMSRCIFSDGQTWPFRIVNFDQKKDLCLIRVNRKGLTPIKFRSDLNRQRQVATTQPSLAPVSLIPPSSGSLALSVGHLKDVAAFGMVTMGLHDFQIAEPECPDCVDMGITVSPYPELTRVNGVVYPHRRGIKVLRVYPRSAGESLGLLVGDLVNTINGVRVTERQILAQEAKEIRAGDVMTMTIFRNGHPRELTYKIPNARKTLYDRWGGGPYSERRFGFGPVIVHDSVLDPQDCGGPLVNVEGHVIGLNIARSMRVASFAINIEDVFLFVKTHSPETKLLFQE